MPSGTGFTPAKTGLTRVFIQRYGAGPANPPEYIGYARAGGVAWPQGDTTPIRIPSDTSYDSFDTVGQVKGQKGLPTMPVNARMPLGKSDLIAIAKADCPVDLHVHFGSCQDPSDFNEGWSNGKVFILKQARLTNYSTGDLGALDADQGAPINEDAAFTAEDFIQVTPVLGAMVAAAQITDPQVAVVICDSKTCGECGVPSDGCQFVLSVGGGVTGSPGLPVELNYSKDGGATFTSVAITTMSVSELATDAACVGRFFAVISEAGEAIHYAELPAIYNGTQTWTKVVTGIVATKGPKAIFSLSRTKTWIAAEGGYVYFSSDIASGVAPQTAGDVVVTDLLDIHGVDAKSLVAVGASNTVLLTRNGGLVWQSITGPAVGISLTQVIMLTEYEWIVGTANGKLYYTRDGGVTWVEKGFPGSGSGSIGALSGESGVLYMVQNTGTTAVVFRSIDGGYSWYVLPEAQGLSMPTFLSAGAVAVCREDPNVAFIGGTATAGVDGVLLKIA